MGVFLVDDETYTVVWPKLRKWKCAADCEEKQVRCVMTVVPLPVKVQSTIDINRLSNKPVISFLNFKTVP